MKRDMPPPPRFQIKPLDQRRFFSDHPKGRRKREGMNAVLLSNSDHWRGTPGLDWS
ncbi:MAG: hypothetical protein AAF826_12080 [Pseudomonadota bacterium]